VLHLERVPPNRMLCIDAKRAWTINDCGQIVDYCSNEKGLPKARLYNTSQMITSLTLLLTTDAAR